MAGGSSTSALLNEPWQSATGGPFDTSSEQGARRIRPSRVTGPQLQELYANNAPDWESEEGLWHKIDECNYHLQGGSRFILPSAFLEDVEGRQNMVVIFPQKMVTPLKVVALLGATPPKCMRYAMGLGTTAEETSVNVETWLEPVLEFDVDGRPLVPFRDLSGRLLLEGAAVVKVLSSDAHWRQGPTWLDTLDQEEYDQLSPRRKRRYVPIEEAFDLGDEEIDDPEDGLPVWTRGSKKVRQAQSDHQRFVKVDKDGVVVPRARYHRDSRNRSRHDEHYKQPDRKFEEDRAATRKAYQRDQKEWLARRLPFEVEVISARHCVPLFDDNERIEAILIVRSYDVEDLLAKDLIFGDSLPLLVPAYESGQVTVFELWHTDERDRPYASYYVDGFDYTMFKHETDDGGIELADAVIDLQSEYGCSRLPVRWYWGLNFPLDGVHRKGVPFLWPVLSSINAAEGIATANHVYAWRNAFAGNLIEVNPALLERYGDQLLKNGEVLKFSTGPMENAVVMGKPTPNVTPPPSAGSQQLLQMLLQSAATMSPSDAVFGGAGATSGHDRALSKEYLEIAMSQVMEASRLAVAFIAEMLLEYAVWIAEKTGKPVPVYANTETLQATTLDGKPDRQRSDIIELLPSWLKSNTQVHAYYPDTDADENTRQQLAQQHMQGLVSWDEFRKKAWNDPDPSATLAKVFADQVLRTPEGRQQVLARAQAKWGDESDQEKARLIQEGLLSPKGVPTEARIPFVTQADLSQVAGAPATPGTGSGLGASSAALPPGVVPPPGVPEALAARHFQLDASHAFARDLAKPSGPLGPIGGPANAGGIPPLPNMQPGSSAGMPPGPMVPGMSPGGPVGMPMSLGPVMTQPPGVSLPPGVQGAADQRPFPSQFAAADLLTPGVGGLGGPTSYMRALGGTIAGQAGTAARRYHDLRKAKGGLKKGA